MTINGLDLRMLEIRRNELGMSKDDLCSMTGLDVDRLNGVLTGDKGCLWSDFLVVCDKLGVEVTVECDDE